MAMQTESMPQPTTSRANSHSRNAFEAQPESASPTPIKVTGQDLEPLTDEQRRRLIAVTAYYLAESRNFEPGHETEDWLAAESQVQSLWVRVS
jgi:hypothetical protein